MGSSSAIDFDLVRRLAEQGQYCDQICSAVGYRGDPRSLRVMAQRRGITIPPMPPEEAARRSNEAQRRAYEARKYWQIQAAPAAPPQPRVPPAVSRLNEQLAALRARQVPDHLIAAALRLTSAQAAALGLRTDRARDPYGTDPRRRGRG